jgi:alpha-tubulin suppressor-like RCC1 family protein
MDPNQAAFSYYEACTGDDEYGQLGDDDSYSPYADHFSDTFLNESVLPTQIAAGDWHGCTLEGTVIECFGRNLEGQLGDSTTYDHQGYPQSVLLDNASWIYVTAGGNSTCAIDSNNDAYCWGDNGYGQLGTGDSTYRSGPTLVGGSHKWSQIVISGGHACGITTGGTTLCWGDDTYGQLGDGLGASQGVDLPQAVSGGQTFTKLSVGLSLSCGIEAVTGNLFCWGLNSDGQVGDGKGGFYPYDQVAWSPSQEANSYSWTDVSVSSSGQFVCGIESSLSGLFCWGYNGSGQLGHGDQTSYNTPRASQTYVSAPAAGRRPPVASLQLPAAHTPTIGPAARQTPGVRLRQPSAARRTQRQ